MSVLVLKTVLLKGSMWEESLGRQSLMSQGKGLWCRPLPQCATATSERSPLAPKASVCLLLKLPTRSWASIVLWPCMNLLEQKSSKSNSIFLLLTQVEKLGQLWKSFCQQLVPVRSERGLGLTQNSWNYLRHTRTNWRMVSMGNLNVWVCFWCSINPLSQRLRRKSSDQGWMQ